MARFARFGIALAVGLAANGVLASEIPASETDRQALTEIAKAQCAVSRARDLQALWTVAEDALGNARRALSNGNRAVAIEQAQLASELAALGIAQKSFPPVR
ncbi:MAG: hypothetical protein Q8N51_13845 [Gammaproteobacteria bacterium]|nr:hypothetical protein [Gammaproteobacteria bacterium]